MTLKATQREEIMNNLRNEILKNINQDWKKIAFVISSVLRSNQKNGIFLDENIVHDEIIKLIEGKQIESQGDITQMRFSEVRLSK